MGFEAFDGNKVIKLGNVRLIRARRRSRIHFYAEQSLVVSNSHAHTLVVIVELLGANATLSWLKCLTDVVLGAILIVIVVPDVKDSGTAVCITAAVGIASVPSQVAGASTERILIDGDVYTDSIGFHQVWVDRQWSLLREGQRDGHEEACRH